MRVQLVELLASPHAIMYRQTIALAALIALFTGCTDSGSPVEATPTATISHESTSISLWRDATDNIVFSINRQHGHNATVHFTVENVPTGILASFNPASVSGSALVTTLSVTVISAQLGTYTLQTRVSGEGVEERTIPIVVTVVPPTVASISLTLGQTTATVEQQQTLSIPITISRSGGYTGTVGLTIPELPPGISAEFEPRTLLSSQSTSSLTLSASLAAATSSTGITIRATGTGVVQTSTPLQVIVTPTSTAGVLLIPNSAPVKVRPGESAEATMQVQRFAGYQGPLNFVVSAVPAGITASVTTSDTDPDLVRVLVSAAAEAVIGDKVVTIRATGAGIAAADGQLIAQVVPHPTFTMDRGTDNTAVSITREATVTNALSIFVRRLEGFSEPVRLSAEDVPFGLSILPDIDGFEIGGNDLNALFSMSAAGNTPLGPHTLTIRGVSAVTGKTSSFQLPIIVRPMGSYSIAANPSSITMPHGSQRLVNITITRTGGFTGNISFSMLTTQLGAGAVFTPSTTNGSSVQMLLTIALNMTPRTFTVVIRGVSPGAVNVELPLTVTVTP